MIIRPVGWKERRKPDRALPALLAHELISVPGNDPGRAALNFDVSFDGSLCLWTAERGDPRVEQPGTYSFLQLVDWRFRRLPILALSVTWPRLRRIPDDRWLVVGSVAKRADVNAFTYSSQGAPLHAFHVDQQMRDIRVTENGIWLNYSLTEFLEQDEETVPHRGLYLVDFDGTTKFTLYEASKAKRISWVWESLYLNASGQEAWLYFYIRAVPAKYAIVHVTPDQNVEQFSVPVPRARAFAVHGSRVLFVGNEQYDDILLLHDLHSKQTMEVRLVAAVQALDELRLYPVDWFEYTHARGSRLYLRSGTLVRYVDLAELPDELPVSS